MISTLVAHVKTKSIALGVATLFVAALAAMQLSSYVRAAACPAPSTDYGSVTSTVSVPATATYRIWSRMMAPSTANNAYLLEIDGTQCFSVGGTGISANTWTWVAYKDGNTGSKIDVSLTQGNHSIKMIGSKPDVKLDRVVFASDLACVPTSASGSECDVPADSAPPTVRITAPVANSNVSGKISVDVTATDNTSVSKVELYVNSSLLGTDTGSPYNFQWDTNTVANGAQLLTAKAYDSAGSLATDSFKVSVQNGDKQAPTVPAGFSGTAPAYNKVELKWSASTDNVGVAGYTVLRDTVPIATVTTGTAYTDTPVSANTSYGYQVSAFDAAGNKSANSSKVTVKTPNVADTQAPTPPTRVEATSPSSKQVNLTWEASTDNIGVVAYDVYRSDNGGVAQKITTVLTTSFGDTALKQSTKYSYYVVAKDAADNASQPSQTTSVTTPTVKKRGALTGVIRDAKTKKPIPYATIVVTIGSSRNIYQANKSGKYTVRNLESGRYNVSYRAPKHYTKTFSIKIADKAVVTKNVALQKR